MSLKEDYELNAETIGSVARYINHSCNPNTVIQIVEVCGQYRASLFSISDIDSGEEVTFDYNLDIQKNGTFTTCYCGANNCRGCIEKFTPFVRQKGGVGWLEQSNILRWNVKRTPGPTKQWEKTYGKTVNQPVQDYIKNKKDWETKSLLLKKKLIELVVIGWSCNDGKTFLASYNYLKDNLESHGNRNLKEIYEFLRDLAFVKIENVEGFEVNNKAITFIHNSLPNMFWLLAISLFGCIESNDNENRSIDTSPVEKNVITYELKKQYASHQHVYNSLESVDDLYGEDTHAPHNVVESIKIALFSKEFASGQSKDISEYLRKLVDKKMVDRTEKESHYVELALRLCHTHPNKIMGNKDVGKCVPFSDISFYWYCSQEAFGSFWNDNKGNEKGVNTSAVSLEDTPEDEGQKHFLPCQNKDSLTYPPECISNYKQEHFQVHREALDGMENKTMRKHIGSLKWSRVYDNKKLLDIDKLY